MAGWIKVEKATIRKSEVASIARLLGVSRHHALGLLVEFWAWIDESAVDGVVDACVDADVDATFCTPGFAAALEVVKWVRFERENEFTGRLIIPNAERHFGESLKKRALTSERQARWRANRVDAHVDAHVDAPVDAPPSTRQDKTKTRQDITTKAKTGAKAVAASPLPGWLDKPTWDRFLEARSAMKARATPHAQELLLRDLAKLRAEGQNPTAVLEQSISRSWRGLFAVKSDGQPNRSRDQRTAFADSIIGAVRYGQAAEPADPRDISGEAERVA